MVKNFIQWDDRYSVGINLIDNQHKKLINFTNELYESLVSADNNSQEQFKITIKKAVDYVKVHFSTEEELMIKYNYPDYLNHKKEHGDFVLKILEEVRDFENNKLFVPNRFVRFLQDWLLGHIAMTDHKYKDFFERHGVR